MTTDLIKLTSIILTDIKNNMHHTNITIIYIQR